MEEDNSQTPKEQSLKEQRVRGVTKFYYSRPEIQKAIYEFSLNREICPRYFEGFGKRPDCFQYPSDIYELVKKGATSFHCSEELWSDPLKIETGMSSSDSNKLRMGWDFIIDIDSKYIDYSKVMAKLIIKVMNFHGIKNVGIKFSGSKGFHLIVPWKAFPKQFNNLKTSDMFPEWPRIMTNYMMHCINNELIEKISELERPNKYVKDYTASKEVIPDLVLVSSTHLFRMPYSLHEKTALASVVLNQKELENFELIHADPMKIQIKNFIPDSIEGEASELLSQSLDWYKSSLKKSGDYSKVLDDSAKKQEYKPIKIANISDEFFPPCILKAMNGIADGKKRALFAMLNFFRSIGMEREEVEKKLYAWNSKNKEKLLEGYIKTQIDWNYKRKPLMPPNCREFYMGFGVCCPDSICNLTKNPVNYTVRKNFISSNQNNNSKKSNSNKSPAPKNPKK
jgi:hypothetical protein